MKQIFATLLLFVGTISYTQDWETFGSTSFQDAITILKDSSDGTIYIGGAFRYFNDTIDARGIVKWNGSSFENLGLFPNSQCNNFNCNPVHSISLYQGDIYCSLINPAPDVNEISGIAKWDGTSWSSLGSGVDGGVFDQIIFEDDLYVMGRFGKADSIEVNSIAKWDGLSWSSVDFPYNPLNEENISINTATVFENELYVGGNFWNQGLSVRDVAKFNGENWYPVGNGIKGGADDVSDIEVFDGELYVAGDFRKSSGNAGNKIMKLSTNNEWIDVDGSFDSEYGVVQKIISYGDHLYAFGVFESVGGGIPANNIAIWDGNSWCGFPEEIDGQILDASISEDELIIVGSFSQIGSFFIDNIAISNKATLLDNCPSLDVINVNSDSKREAIVSPNPNIGEFTLSLNPINGQFMPEISIFNIEGKECQSQITKINPNKFQISGLNLGAYFLRLQFDLDCIYISVVVIH